MALPVPPAGRTMAVLVAALLLAPSLAPPARASDGSDSDSAGSSGDLSGASGDSSAGSADSSGQSAASSGQSADSSAGTANSSDNSVAESTGNSVQGSVDASGQSVAGTSVVSATTLAAGTTVGGVFLTVYLVKHAHAPKAAPEEGTAQGRALLQAQLLNADRDMGLLLALTAASPSVYDQLELEVAAGEGPNLDAVARAMRVPRAEVCAAFVAAGEGEGAVEDDAAALRRVVRLVEGVAPALRPDATFTGDLLWDLARERRRADFPAAAPVHARVARWMGVPPDVVVAASGAVLAEVAGAPDGPPSLRARLAADPLGIADRLADRIEAADAADVQAQLARLVAPVRRIDPALAER